MVACVVGLMIAGCSTDSTSSEEYEALEQELVAARDQVEELTAERDALAGTVASQGQTSPVDTVGALDLVALADAWGSGDADQIRAFYTEDAVMVPFGHILSQLSDHPMPEYWDVSGPDIEREAAEHEGGTFEFIEARQIGNMLVATGQWTFPEGLFPDSELTVIKTADVTHLRDGRIWRVFSDFEVYVDGQLMEM